MSTFMKLSFVALLGLGSLAVAGTSRAQGAVLGPGSLDPAARSSLEAEIARARIRHPGRFKAARSVDTFRPKAVARSRSNRPSAARAFLRLGPSALLPMLEMIAWKADLAGLDDEQRLALGDGLLQAVAFARDPRAAPVLTAVFSKSQEPRFIASAAAGLGMLCRLEDRSLLLSHASLAGPRRAAAIAGLGHCRSPETAEKLAAVMAEPLDDALARVTARALGYVGSSWALAAAKFDPKQAETIRSSAATALADAYPRHEGEVRQVIARALLMVEHPASLPALRELERTGSAGARKEASRLRTRLEKNLARRR